MKTLRSVSRIITGVVFIFSGFVKAVDPLGSAYKFADYFNAFHIGFLSPGALPLSIFLSSTELLIGITLLLGFRMRIAAWILLIFMSFFTLLTFILALTNPVTDCGCFGDALILTNWQTFFKNIVLMVFVLVIFTGRSKFTIVRGPTEEWAVILLFYSGAVIFSLYNYHHLPLLDFRPYSVGTNINDGMIIPPGAPEDEYKTELIYKNKESGKESVFTMENFPRDTVSWQFVDARSELVKKGYEPPIHNFNIVAPDGNDITSHILSEPGFTFILISYDAAEADTGAIRSANDLFHLSQTMPALDFYAVTASNEDVLSTIRQNTGIGYDFCLADEITLKTIVRSNPGLLLVKDGTIIAKWGRKDFPGPEDLRAYSTVFSDFPLCQGCIPKEIDSPPFGSAQDKFETVLRYRNTVTDSIASFSIENFPKDKEKWAFVNSETTKIPGGFKAPLENLKINAVYGMDLTELALNNENISFLAFLRSPFETNPLLLKKLNEFAGMAGEHLTEPFEFFGLTALGTEEILHFTDEFISPVEFYHIPAEALDIVDFKEVLLIMLRQGRVEKVWKDENFPETAALDNIVSRSLKPAEQVLMPMVLGHYRQLMEKRMVFTLIFIFFTIVCLFRTVLDSRLIKKKHGRQDH